MSEKWLLVCKVSEVPNSSAKAFDLDGHRIAIFHAEGKFFALANACIHRGGPLCEGYVENAIVTCPWHAWDFELGSGKCVTMDGAKQPMYKLKMEKDQLFIKLN